MTGFNPFSDEQDPFRASAGFPIPDFSGDLNEEQYEAVTAPFGPALVLAGAGSGKTRTLTYRVAWLLSQGVRPDQILLLTFTNKAAREMLDRVEDLTGVPAHKFWGGTFHHIGQKILRRFGQPVGIGPSFTIMDESDAESLLQSVIRETDAGYLKVKDNPKPRLIESILSYTRNTRGRLSEVIEKRFPEFTAQAEAIAAFARHYAKVKLERQVADYDDLLEKWLELLEKETDLQEYFGHRFSHLLVDEYQDTNALQSAIIDRMAPHHRIMAVGDDAQCIYTWRGADFDNIMSFPDRHPGTTVYKIETNYRSTPNILDFANGVLTAQGPGRGYAKELKAVRPPTQEPYVIQTLDTRQQAKFIVERIRSLEGQGISLNEIAVLYRAHYQAMDIQQELSREQIPFQITSGVRFFEQAHVRDLTAHLRFVCNPTDISGFLRIATLLPKVGPRTAEKLLEATKRRGTSGGNAFFEALAHESVLAKVPGEAKEDWKALALTLQDLRQALPASPPAHLVQIAAEGWYGTYLRRTFANARNREEDLQSLVGFAHAFTDITELLSQLVLLGSETGQSSYRPEGDQVRLTTVHQAKGLEFGIVFVIGLGDGWFPLRRAIEADDLEEERRLFYVAVTRAKDELYLIAPKISSGAGPLTLMPPSRFINEVEPHLYRREKLFQAYS